MSKKDNSRDSRIVRQLFKRKLVGSFLNSQEPCSNQSKLFRFSESVLKMKFLLAFSFILLYLALADGKWPQMPNYSEPICTGNLLTLCEPLTCWRSDRRNLIASMPEVQKGLKKARHTVPSPNLFNTTNSTPQQRTRKLWT